MLIKVALLNKVGEGGMKHYGYDEPPDPTNKPNLTQPVTTPIADPPAPTEEEGMYL
jgi:hypothetical protein